MSELDATVKSLIERHQKRDGQLLSLLKAPDDLTSLVLRGHLVVEELLFSAIAMHCADPTYLKDAKLRFPQMAALLRALDKLPSVHPKIWVAVTELNSLRNSLAHVLEPKDIAKRVEKFITALDIDEKLTVCQESYKRLEYSLHYLIGNLSAAATFQGSLEALIQHRLAASADEP